MPGKDDPIQQTKTLWLDRDAMQIARERYWHALATAHGLDGSNDERRIWDIAWAAAVAVHSFIAEGRLGPPVGGNDDHD